MIRALALLLVLLILGAALLLCASLTNWFRYSLSLEATLVLAAAVLGIVAIAIVSYVAYTKNSTGWIAADAFIAVASIAAVLLVHDHAIGGLPRLHASHREKGPPAVLQTQRGEINYWIELQNPFSADHAEFLVLKDGKERRIPIEVFSGPTTGYASAAKPADWATLSLTPDPNIAVLTVGPLLSPSNQRFRIDLTTGTATRLPAS
jgi:hypothetical protein